MNRKILGITLMTGGSLALVLSLMLILTNDAPGTEDVASSTESPLPTTTTFTTAAAATLAPTPTSSSTTTTTSTTIPEPGSRVQVAAFVGQFGAAIERGDSEFAFAVLHQSVVEAFGEDTCRSWLDEQIMPRIGLFATSAPRGPTPATVETPDGPLEFPESWLVDVTFTFAEEPVAATSVFVVDDDNIYLIGSCAG